MRTRLHSIMNTLFAVLRQPMRAQSRIVPLEVPSRFGMTWKEYLNRHCYVRTHSYLGASYVRTYWRGGESYARAIRADGSAHLRHVRNSTMHHQVSVRIHQR